MSCMTVTGTHEPECNSVLPQYQSNPAYSFGDAQNAWKLDNGYILNQYYYADDSMLDRPTMSGVEIQ